MAGRRVLKHDGFFVPNAQDVAKPELAEPDRIDFNTIAHARWGVINGCLVTVAGSTATVGGHRARQRHASSTSRAGRTCTSVRAASTTASTSSASTTGQAGRHRRQ